MTKFDSLVLKLFTKLAHGVQWAMGVTCYRLAEQAFIIAALGCTLRVVSYWLPLLAQLDAPPILITFYAINGFILLGDARTAAKCEASWGARETLPAETLRFHGYVMQAFRTFFVILSVCDIVLNIALLAHGGFVLGYLWLSMFCYGIASGLYLMIVTPMPKQRLKVLVPIRDAG